MIERRTFLTALASIFALERIGRAQQTPAPDDVIADLVAANHILAMENVLDAMGQSACAIQRVPIAFCWRARCRRNW